MILQTIESFIIKRCLKPPKYSCPSPSYMTLKPIIEYPQVDIRNVMIKINYLHGCASSLKLL